MQTHPPNAARCATVDAPASRPTEPPTLGAAPPTEAGRLDLAGGACRVLRVDGLVPRHCADRADRRARLRYLPREIAHFEWSGHRYAVVPADDPGRPGLGDGADAPPTDLTRLLTRREMQIVQLICLGYLTKQVADRLHLSEFTVRSYLKSTYAKLGVRSRAALVYRYTQAFRGTVAPEARARPPTDDGDRSGEGDAPPSCPHGSGTR